MRLPTMGQSFFKTQDICIARNMMLMGKYSDEGGPKRSSEFQHSTTFAIKALWGGKEIPTWIRVWFCYQGDQDTRGNRWCRVNKSELGIILSDFNRQAISRYLDQNRSWVYSLISYSTYAYVWKNHPLANHPKSVSFGDLADYPNMTFDQEIIRLFILRRSFSADINHHHMIKVNDRATMLNLMQGLFSFGVLGHHLWGAWRLATWCQLKMNAWILKELCKSGI